MDNRGMNELAALRRGLGNPRPPTDISQKPYDGDSDHLYRLARLGPDDKPDPSDLIQYTHDIRYEARLQKSLLLWVLPICLQAWRDNLRGADIQDVYGGFVEHFYPALADGPILHGVLDSAETQAVAAYMRDAILEEMDDQRGLAFSGMNVRPYTWMYALTTYGVILPDIQKLWVEWWSLKTPGRAIAAVEYISCLVYGEDNNPIFSPWTREGGGGPPCLWEFAGHLYTHRWLEPNVQFLSSMLRAPKVIEVLRGAISRLADESEAGTAGQVLAGALGHEDVLASRCDELPRILAKAQKPEVSFEWSL